MIVVNESLQCEHAAPRVYVISSCAVQFGAVEEPAGMRFGSFLELEESVLQLFNFIIMAYQSGIVHVNCKAQELGKSIASFVCYELAVNELARNSAVRQLVFKCPFNCVFCRPDKPVLAEDRSCIKQAFRRIAVRVHVRAFLAPLSDEPPVLL